MYSPDEQGGYTPADGTQAFTVQGLTDALSGLQPEDTVVESPKEELILQLEVTMADCPGRPHPPAFSWNASMVMHILKNDPALRDLGVCSGRQPWYHLSVLFGQAVPLWVVRSILQVDFTLCIFCDCRNSPYGGEASGQCCR